MHVLSPLQMYPDICACTLINYKQCMLCIAMYVQKLLACFFYPAITAFAQEPLDKNTACYVQLLDKNFICSLSINKQPIIHVGFHLVNDNAAYICTYKCSYSR